MPDCSDCDHDIYDCLLCENQINSGGVFERRWEALKKFMEDQSYHNNQIANCALFAMKQIERSVK